MAYIGNKRKLLPLLLSSLLSVYGEIPRGAKFIDLFAGSGVVSRFAKYLGFSVVSNDWEPYSFVMNSAYICTGSTEAEELFADEGGLAAVLDRLNSLPEPEAEDRYVSAYYSAQNHDIAKSDFKKERLFYTLANGLAIDKIRSDIERRYADTENPRILKKRHILIALLVYEAATHTNTSGVFKACHKGFGGHGKDSLKRICTEIRLQYPVLIDSDFNHAVHKEDALALVSREEYGDAEVAYLDPPYNQHQYGSNYHLLNTIALWDKPSVPLVKNADGTLKEKAGIRKDWGRTRSNYCYRDKASGVFEELLDRVRARNIFVSYSTDGIIPFPDLVRICEKKGRVSVETNQYTKYKGGKQSNNRENMNIEFVLAIRPGRKNTASGRKKILDTIRKKRFFLLLKKRHSYKRLSERFLLSKKDRTVTFSENGSEVKFHSRYFLDLSLSRDFTLDGNMESLVSALEYTACSTKEEELEEILIRFGMFPGSQSLALLIPEVLKKLAHKKNKLIFYACLKKARKLVESDPSVLENVAKKLDLTAELAEKRFSS